MKSNTGRGLVLGAFSLLFILVLFLRTSPAVIAHDLMKSFSIPSTTLGLIAAVYFWVYGLAQIPVGILTDRIGVRYTVFACGLLGVVGTLLFAFAIKIQIVFLARILIGVGTAGVWVPTLKYLSQAYPPDKFASLTSIFNSIGGFGFLLSTYPLAFLVERTNWRTPFYLAAALLLLFIILAWSALDSKFVLPSTAIEEKPEKKAKPAIFYLINYRFIYFIFWAFLIYGALFSIQALWGATYLQDVFSVNREMAGMNLMFTSIGLILGGPLWGLMSDRFLKARKPILVWGTLGFLLILVLFRFKTFYWGFLPVSLIYFFLGLFGTIFLINFTSAKELFPLNVTGTAIGILNSVMIAGVGFFQSATGYLIDYFTTSYTVAAAYQKVFFMYCICAVIAFSLTLLMPETFELTQTHPEQSKPGKL